jgi:hypothetical protein
MVKETSRTRNDNLWLSAKIRDLATVRHTTVNRHTLDSSAGSELLDNVIDLLCKLTRRCENERLAPLLFTATDLLEDRQNKGRRLSGASLRESDYVVTLYSERDRLCLNWSRGFVADRLNRFLEEMGERKIVKGIRADLFRS